MTMMLKYRANVCVAVQVLEPSQFIKEIPHHLLNFQVHRIAQPLLPDDAALAYAHNVSCMQFTRVFLFVVTPYFCSTSLLCKAVSSL
jgi:hypothetical protein